MAPMFQGVEVARRGAGAARSELMVAMGPTEGMPAHGVGATSRDVTARAGRHKVRHYG